jgi:mRNA interferase MazF
MLTSGDAVRLDLGVSEGREAGFFHPAVVVTAQRILDARPSVVQIVPLTSTLRGFQTEVVVEPDPGNSLRVASAVQCQHLRAVASSRIGPAEGNIGRAALLQVRETIALILDLS